MLTQLFEDPLNAIIMICFIGIDQNVFQVYNIKNIQFFSQDFIDLALKTGGSIDQTRRYNLILKITIPNSKHLLLFISFLNTHLMIYTD